MTNLIAIVAMCIVTNVTTADNGIGGCPYGAGCLVIGCNHQPPKPATEKTETTEVVEVLTIKINPEQLRTLGWVGGLIEGEQKRVLSRKVKRWILKDNWVEE